MCQHFKREEWGLNQPLDELTRPRIAPGLRCADVCFEVQKWDLQ